MWNTVRTVQGGFGDQLGMKRKGGEANMVGFERFGPVELAKRGKVGLERKRKGVATTWGWAGCQPGNGQ